MPSRPPAHYRDLLITGLRTGVLFKTASYTVVPSDSGTTFFADAADLVFTLPPTQAGLWYRFILTNSGLSTGTGLSISPNSADAINGNGLTSVDDKDVILAGSGDREGDSIMLIADGSDGWYIASVTGTWTKES